MKVLIVNSNDIKGGAAKAAYRLNKGLQKIGVSSQMLVQEKTSSDSSVLTSESKCYKIIPNTRPRFNQLPVHFYKNRLTLPFSPAWLPFSNIVNKIHEIKPDIVHLHFITNGMIHLKDLLKIKCPIVWSLHDMWAFTGGCHYDNYCNKFQSQCFDCPILNSNKKNDLSKRIFKQKNKIYNKLDNITIVGLSKWMADCASKSVLLGRKDIKNIPNPIDTDLYQPIEKKIARKILNLPLDKKFVLFGADCINDYLKGFDFLRKALECIDQDNIELLILGSVEKTTSSLFRFPAHFIGKLNDEISMKILYNAADVTVLPSLQENLSNVVIESLSCGTPVVAFNIGGNGDMIEHKKNGYLANMSSSDDDLLKGINWILKNPDYDSLKHNARMKVLNEFEMIKVAQCYKNLYETILFN
ncbi:MAG: glycosyltransferase family 4 protein [Pseudomonadota bacterium]